MILKNYRYDSDPFRLFKVFKDEKYPFFLDSSLKSEELGRFSFIGFDPFFILKTTDKEDPFEKLRRLLNKYRIPPKKKISPFLGGAVGYFSYDLGFILERIESKATDDLNLPTCIFGFYDTLLIVDHLKKRLMILSSGFPEKNSYLKEKRAKYRLNEIVKRLSNYQENLKRISFSRDNYHTFVERKPQHRFIFRDTYNESKIPYKRLHSNFKKEDYIKAIKKAKDYIRCGDIYQVNLSQRFSVEYKFSSIDLYGFLRETNPAPFSAYLDFGDFQILSSSPERFLTLRGKKVFTRPMKGTRPRGENLAEDRTKRLELLNSQKDKAELIMIVDLERNDLGKVCEYGSIRVRNLRNLEVYSRVFQTTAEIEGILHRDREGIDLIKECFPGGSITGCPKIRAMEIIEELEPTKRSIYTGSLGYLSFSGDMDLNILIRTLLLKNKRVYFQVGGGVVSDSSPEKEYQETLDKAEALIEALSQKILWD